MEPQGNTPAPAPAAGQPAGAAPEADLDATRIRPAASPPTHGGQTLPSGRAAAGAVAGAPAGAVMRQVGRYQVIDRLGRGGMASVFKAHDPAIDRVIALKFLHAALCEDVQYRARFLREARAAGNLSHPNIVTVFDVGEIEGRPYMAMELLDGEPLNEAMADHRPMPLREALEIALQLARALDYAHAKGVVHRDIKPANIVRLRGANVVKVTDFGIAHVNASGEGMAQTRAGDVLGTPQYMSPEQTLGQPVDGRSDLFSVGIVLYQMLTGQRPFDGDSVVALAVKIAREEPPPVDKLRPELPAAVRRIVERCLAKQPGQRYQTGMELAEAIAKVLWTQQQEGQRRDRERIVPLRVKWAATMALLVAVVMAGAGWLFVQRQSAALMAQVMDYGATLARFLASQNAVNALAEEWEPVDVAVQEAMKSHDFQAITLVDRAGIVRASGVPGLVGQPWQPPPGRALATLPGEVQVLRQGSRADDAVLAFVAPIRFQGKQVGRVALGLSEQPLARVIGLSHTLMATLVLITVAAVAVAMYFVGEWFARPVRALVEAAGELARGRLDHRIGERRNDELGQLAVAFDAMAQALQARYAPETLVAPPSTSKPTSTPVPAAASPPTRTPTPTPNPSPSSSSTTSPTTSKPAAR